MRDLQTISASVLASKWIGAAGDPKLVAPVLGTMGYSVKAAKVK